MSANRDRSAKNPGGMQCERCNETFIGEEWHTLCGICIGATASEIAKAQATTPSPAATVHNAKLRSVYDKLAQEGGGTWATYMMMDIAAAYAEAAAPSEVHRLFKHAWARFSCLADEAAAQGEDGEAQKAMCEVDAGMMQEGMALATALTAPGTASREFINELGNIIRITIEGPTSTSTNDLTPVEFSELAKTIALRRSGDSLEALGQALDTIMSASCEHQRVAAASIAGNIGMVLVNEPPHPDSPHVRRPPSGLSEAHDAEMRDLAELAHPGREGSWYFSDDRDRDRFTDLAVTYVQFDKRLPISVAEPCRCDNPGAPGESKEAGATTGDAPVASASTSSIAHGDVTDKARAWDAIAAKNAEIADLKAVLARFDGDIKALADPNVVHMNMLRGGIAKPSWAQILHLYQEEGERLERGVSDSARLDFLDGLNARLNAHCGTNYRWAMTINHNVNRLSLKFPTVDLNDAEAHGLKSCRDAIDAVMRRIEADRAAATQGRNSSQ